MANSENLFSRSFRGFSPDEVIAYIEELNAAMNNASKEALERAEELNSIISKLENECEALREKADKSDALVQKNEELSSELERLSNDNENQRLAITDSVERINELEKQNESLKTELEAALIKCEALKENSKEYESMLSDVDNILSSARRNAEALIDEAKTKSAEIIENAEHTAKIKAAAVIAQSDEKVSDNLKKVKYLYRRKDELAELFREHKNKVDGFFASLSDSLDKK